MANIITIAKLTPNNCPLGFSNCIGCHLFGDVDSGSVICYHEDNEDEDEE